jgi:hypothetical protein
MLQGIRMSGNVVIAQHHTAHRMRREFDGSRSRVRNVLEEFWKRDHAALDEQAHGRKVFEIRIAENPLDTLAIFVDRQETTTAHAQAAPTILRIGIL